MNNYCEFNDVYYIIDKIQLTDVEENFAMNMHGRFELDPSPFVTLPSLSWKAAIETTRVELKLLIDFNMILFYEKRRNKSYSSFKSYF